MPTLCEREIDLSIIVPVYNLEEWITPMLDSLKAQDMDGYAVEIIFILNNCTDDTEGVIRRSGIDCKIIECTTQGCGPARNAGLEIARGEYVWMIDGDDWLLSDTAVKQILDRVKRDGMNILRIPFCHEKYKYNYFSMVMQYVMKRDYIKEFQFPNYQPAEDDAFMDMVLRKAGYNRDTYMFLPFIKHELYYYNYMRPGSNMYRYHLGEKI